MLYRILSITRKEFLHVVRDRRTLAVMFLIPVVQLLLLGYAATTDVKHLRTAVLDQDRTPRSRALVEAYRASGYFDITYQAQSQSDLRKVMDGSRVRAGLIIPAGYERTLLRGQKAQVAFVIDGSDPAVATTALAAAQGVGQAQSIEIVSRSLGARLESAPGIDVETRVWYNPSMESANFMIPGLIGVILMMLTMLFTAMAIVREREQGTIEQLIVTPIRPLELIVGKVIPYVGIAFWDLLEILAIGVLWFGIPIHGSVALLLELSAVFLATSLGLGILISTVSKTQQEAMMLTFMLLLPSIFLSGYFFPIDAMPPFLQAVSRLVPLTYVLVIVRSIILKGSGFALLAQEVITLAVFGLGVVVLASVRFRKRLE
ncbi:MAG: ABC transporter permease [Anaerolineae bacterium]|jgi:ABC-2 type transport system permease protein|nr:ABC transporter permease [Anaerolineae bacterium]